MPSRLPRWVSDEVPGLLKKHGVAGVAIGVTDASRSCWSAGFGQLGAHNPRPVTENTMFSVQSCSKAYTAAVVMLAVQGGLLELDRPITSYLPEFTVNSTHESRPERRITLRHLLSHTAGFTHEAPVGNNFVVGRQSFDEHCRSIADTWLRFPVGHHFEYSNLGIDLAASALERLSGMPFHRFAANTLFGPLGLERTTFHQPAIARDRDRATGHEGAARLPIRIPMVAAGGLYASAKDACRLLEFLLRRGEGLLLPRLVDEMVEIPFKQPGQGYGYALGLAIESWATSGDVIGHSGGGFGFSCDMFWSPAAGVGVVVLTNSAQRGMLNELTDRLLSEFAGRPAPAAKAPARPPWQPSERDTDAMAGEFIGRFSTLSLRNEGGALVLRSGDQDRPLRMLAPGEAWSDAGADGWKLMPERTAPARYLQSMADGKVWYRNEVRSRHALPGGTAGRYLVRRAGAPWPQVALAEDARGAFIRLAGGPAVRLEQQRPGLWFSTTGEALDLRATPITYANLRLERRRDVLA